MNCPHCQTELTPHDTPHGAKRGALHCDGCGCCFLSDGKTQRPGVPECDLAQAPVVETTPVEPEPVAESDEEDPKPESAPRRRSRG